MVGASILDFAVTDICSQTAFNRRSVACLFVLFDTVNGGLSMTWPQGLGGYQTGDPIVRLFRSMLHAACEHLALRIGSMKVQGYI